MTTNSHTYTATIKQHTPLLHFHRPDNNRPLPNYPNHKLPEVQTGATLRATELKPKFDKFLADLPNLKLKDHWKQKKKEKSLDYKVSIIPEGAVKTSFIEKFNAPMFFANKGTAGTDKVLSFTDQPIKVVFFSLHSDLLDLIALKFGDFLFRHNFGTRQSKGYGSFSLIGNNEKSNRNSYLYTESMGNLGVSQRSTKALEIINFYYQRLKSGINFGKRCIYYDSYLKIYLANKLNSTYLWEKKWLKEPFLPAQVHTGKPRLFARSLLGLSGSVTFMNKSKAEQFRCKDAPKEKRQYPENETVIKIEHLNGTISRFKSPILFKPIFDGKHWQIFIHLIDNKKEEEENIFDKTFSFHYSEIDSNKKTVSEYNRELSTPPEPLDINELVKSYHKHLGEEFEAFSFSGSLGKVKIINP